MTAARPAFPLFLKEFSVVSLWVISTLVVSFSTTTTLLHTRCPALTEYPPSQIFLIALTLIMAIWELFGLTYGSPLNPVMTVCLGLSGKLPTAEALVMMAAEFAAHLFGVFVVRNIAMYAFEAHANGSFLPPRPHAGVSQMLAVFIEAGLTGTVCLVALSLDHIFPKSASVKRWFFITLFVIVGISVGGNWTGGVMNPAISFALALHEGTWTAHGVYWAGPLSGGIAAAALYTNVVRYHSTALKGIKSKRAAPRSAMARLKHQ